jgi:glucose-6-phosphate isomerase
MMRILKDLLEAAEKSKNSVSTQNPFREIGFDGNKPRLGWVKPPSWEMIEEVLRDLSGITKDKEEFIFVGMGGSINGIKTLCSLKKDTNFYTLDSLDPRAANEVLKKIGKMEKTLVVPISKSGSTLETMYLAQALRCVFGKRWENNFLWLADRESFSKLDSAGFRRCPKFTIQVNGASDIGGRFSSPHTLIFLFPLFLIMKRDLKKVKRVYLEYTSLRDRIIEKAYRLALNYRSTKRAYFYVKVEKRFIEGIRTWITQLFQESLGSKRRNLLVKTLVGSREESIEAFSLINFDMEIDNPLVHLMSLMCYLEFFVACFAYFKRINFVNQPYVEKYKQKMQELREREMLTPRKLDLEGLVGQIKKRLRPSIKFLEAVLYFHPHNDFAKDLKRYLEGQFPEKKSLVFSGSDWNHHSYQAAYLDKSTLYIILSQENYYKDVLSIRKNLLQKNINTLQKIAYATYQTLQDKSLFFCI